MKNEQANTQTQPITIECIINSPIEKVWAMGTTLKTL